MAENFYEIYNKYLIEINEAHGVACCVKHINISIIYIPIIIEDGSQRKKDINISIIYVPIITIEDGWSQRKKECKQFSVRHIAHLR